tara:strand:+ start:3825 stop:4415 length:591 start_codon:yes stop_codon:yes gene_type:complete
MSIKKEISDTMRKLYSKKYISIRDGNVSFKPKFKNYFYISAGSVKKNEMNEDQVMKVGFTGTNIYYDKSYMYKPSRELNLHSLLQMAPEYHNKDTFIVHAHPPNITAFIGIQKSQELKEIQNIFPEVNVGKIGDNVKFHEAGSFDLAEDCYNKLLNNKIIGMERHGSLSIGPDLDKIFEDIETLEYYIDIALKSKN